MGEQSSLCEAERRPRQKACPQQQSYSILYHILRDSHFCLASRLAFESGPKAARGTLYSYFGGNIPIEGGQFWNVDCRTRKRGNR